MPFSRIRTSFRIAAVFVASTAICAGAQAGGNPEAKRASCDTYARMAEVQTEANQKYRCDFHGPDWTSDRHSHYEWCMFHRRDDLVDMTRYRAVELQKCFNNLGDYDDDNYDRSYKRRF